MSTNPAMTNTCGFITCMLTLSVAVQHRRSQLLPALYWHIFLQQKNRFHKGGKIRPGFPVHGWQHSVEKDIIFHLLQSFLPCHHTHSSLCESERSGLHHLLFLSCDDSKVVPKALFFPTSRLGTNILPENQKPVQKKVIFQKTVSCMAAKTKEQWRKLSGNLMLQ